MNNLGLDKCAGGVAKVAIVAVLLGATSWALPEEAHAQAATAAPASADQPASAGQLQEIVVTAQKRQESANTVGMSIQALSGATLQAQHITDVKDLVSVIPGFSYAPSPYATPVYTLRGVGLYDSGLGSSPAVAIYVDEVPLPFPVMTRGATLDLQRIEVLKGPQGTLFGGNSTGGAINYIANKPTSMLAVGGSIGDTNFGQVNASAYISGPISDTLSARLSVNGINGGAWQYNVNQPNQRNGSTNLLNGRLLVDWHPTSALKVEFKLTGDVDRSDTQAPQLIALSGTPADNAFLNSRAPGGAVLFPAHTPRAASWDPGWPLNSNERFYQASAHAAYALSPTVTLTDITSFAHQTIDRNLDEAGDGIPTLDDSVVGRISSFYQELRISGDTPSLKWLAGVNYEHDKVFDSNLYNTIDYPGNDPLGTGHPFIFVDASVRSKTNTYAVFANADPSFGDLTAHLGIRYTRSNLSARSCSNGGNNPTLPNLFNFLEAAVFNPSNPNTIGVGQCYQENSVTKRLTATDFLQTLNQGNLSWRVGLDYKISRGVLVYANYSRGYKSGVITDISASNTAQFFPAHQERLDAAEGGFKASMFDRRLQLNAAGFYYNYTDKQVRLRFQDPIFSLLETVVNLPKSHIAGAEFDLTAKPVPELTLRVNGTYLDSAVDSDFSNSANGLPVYNQAGQTGNFKNAELPYTPKWSGLVDVEYLINGISSKVQPFIGASVHYTGSATANLAVGQVTAVSPTATDPASYKLVRHTLVDLRAGVRDPNGHWNFMIWGTNVFNKFYDTTAFDGDFTLYRYTGEPATYGATLGFDF